MVLLVLVAALDLLDARVCRAQQVVRAKKVLQERKGTKETGASQVRPNHKQRRARRQGPHRYVLIISKGEQGDRGLTGTS